MDSHVLHDNNIWYHVDTDAFSILLMHCSSMKVISQPHFTPISVNQDCIWFNVTESQTVAKIFKGCFHLIERRLSGGILLMVVQSLHISLSSYHSYTVTPMQLLAVNHGGGIAGGRM